MGNNLSTWQQAGRTEGAACGEPSLGANKAPPAQLWQDPACGGGVGAIEQGVAVEDLHYISAIGRGTVTEAWVPPNCVLWIVDRHVPGLANWINEMPVEVRTLYYNVAQGTKTDTAPVGDASLWYWNPKQPIKGVEFWVTALKPGHHDLRTKQIGSVFVSVGSGGGYNSAAGRVQPQVWNDRMVGAVLFPEAPWSAFATACCAGILPGEMCGDLYGPGNNFAAGCGPIMAKYCGASLSNAELPACQQWIGRNQSEGDKIMASLCDNVDGVKSKVCQDWCKRNPGRCDNAMLGYCAAHPHDAICTCITSPVTKYNPACVDPECIRTGYPTSGMKAMGACPNIVDCSTQIELQSAGRTTVGNISVQQNCGMAGAAPPPKGEPITAGQLIIFIFLVLFVIAAAFIHLVNKGRAVAFSQVV